MECSLIGTDEAGKGDYFGPLVVAAFSVGKGNEPRLTELGVRDSKQLSDKKVTELSDKLKKTGHHSIVVIGPQKYNQLYQSIGNLNRLLAWGHARVIENMLEQVRSPEVLSDKFGDDSYITRALMEKGKQVKLVQKEKAEENPVVAAASIIARAEFLLRLEKLSEQSGLELPKGASDKVDQAARRLVELKGKEYLETVAKLHFKNTERILCTRT